MIEKINILPKDKLNEAPKTAGVYLFYAKLTPNTKHPTPIYIGKAINLRDRIKNHFQQPSYRDHLFIEKVTDIGFLNTDSEIEALVLEANLIKKYLPRFNVVWKDGKNYFYVCITKDERPMVFITHQKNDGRATYIGPFVEGNALKKTLRFLRRVFPFYSSKNHSKNKCTYCHLGLCPGPNPDVTEYKKNLKKLTLILKGQRGMVLRALKKEMESLSKQQLFEKALTVRDQMYALQQVMSHTRVIENSQGQMADGEWQKTQLILQALLHLKNTVSRVECYDISNIQGKMAVGSMVVFTNGSQNKSLYKKFSIRLADTSDTNIRMHTNNTNTSRNIRYELLQEKPNDIAMLKQVLTRRLAHPEWGYPEVMLIDGGIAQLNVAIHAKNEVSEAQFIKIISIAKGRQELFIEGQKDPIPLKELPQGVYNLIKHLDDEAHRFAITYHKLLRSKKIMGRNA